MYIVFCISRYGKHENNTNTVRCAAMVISRMLSNNNITYKIEAIQTFDGGKIRFSISHYPQPTANTKTTTFVQQYHPNILSTNLSAKTEAAISP